jgi:polysaccharide export outer membrane protein
MTMGFVFLPELNTRIALPLVEPLWLLTVLAASMCGCHHGQVYQAARLPGRFEAAPIRSAQSLNLSRLADGSHSVEVIQAGDVLEVSVATGLEEREPAMWLRRVAADGSISVPLVGTVAVGGLKLSGAEAVVAAAAVQREVFRSPNVAVTFQTRQSNRIVVVGAVESPGVKELPLAASSLVDALVAAGGLTEDASSIVEIRYSPSDVPPAADSSIGIMPASYADVRDSVTTRIDLQQLEASGTASPPLRDGAVLTIVRRPPPTINVVGLVQKPGQYEIPPDAELRLLGAIALGGGRTMQIADKVRIIRALPNQREPIVIAASVREAKANGAENIRLAPGDIVSVEETPLTFSVALIRDFVGFGFTSPIPGF